MYDLQFDGRVEKELDRIPRNVQRKLMDKIQGLAKNPRPDGCVKLSMQEGYRIRQGDYRVLYEINDTHHVVRIYRASHRSDVYKR